MFGRVVYLRGDTVDGRNPAPPTKPWNYVFPVNSNAQWFLMVSKWCRISSIHSMVSKPCPEHVLFQFSSSLVQHIRRVANTFARMLDSCGLTDLGENQIFWWLFGERAPCHPCAGSR